MADRSGTEARTVALLVGAIAVGFLLVVIAINLLSDDGADSAASNAPIADAGSPTTEGEPAQTTAPPTTGAPTTTAPPVPTAVPVDYVGYRAQPTACGAEAPPPVAELSFDAPGDVGIAADASATAIIHTSCGPITVALDPAGAPQTVNSFVFLAEAGYFDGSASHRIIEGFMMQAGDPTATGRGGPGYTIPDELPGAGQLYRRGVVAMANAGPNTSGSQFFIMHGDAALPPSFSIFGEVIDGFDVLDTIAGLPVAPRPGGSEVSTPLETLYIERIEVAVN